MFYGAIKHQINIEFHIAKLQKAVSNRYHFNNFVWSHKSLPYMI